MTDTTHPSRRKLEVFELQTRAHEDAKQWYPDSETSLPVTLLAAQAALGAAINMLTRCELEDTPFTDEKRFQMATQLAEVFHFTMVASHIIGVKLEEALNLFRNFEAEHLIERTAEPPKVALSVVGGEEGDVGPTDGEGDTTHEA